MKNQKQLKVELRKTRDLLSKTSDRNRALKKAVWDILNYANLFIVLLDSNLNIHLSNWSLAHKLGFEDEKAITGRCWLDFIKPEERGMIKNIHKLIATDPLKAEEYREVTNEIMLPDMELLVVKWFNIHINGELNLTLSIGVPRCIPAEESEDSVRSYYRDVIDKDKTFIKSIRETLVSTMENDAC